MPRTTCGFNNTPTVSGSDLLVTHGPSLLVNIGFDPAYRPGASVIPSLPGTGIYALVDTGATESCIDSALATRLNLPIVDRKHIAGVSGPREVNMHLAQIFVPTLTWTIYGSFAGVDLVAGGQLHHALIGRTFLQNFTMVYEGPTGTVTLSR